MAWKNSWKSKSKSSGKPKGKNYTRNSGAPGSYRKAQPTRFRSKRNYVKTRALSRMLTSIGEVKITKLLERNAHQPSPIVAGPATNPVYQQNYVLGQVPTGFNNFNPLEGIAFPVGDGPAQRDGKYMYLKKTTINLKIALNNPMDRVGQIRYRVIVYKQRRNNASSTTIISPTLNLFLDSSGNPFGTDSTISSASSAMEFQTAIVNKKNYSVIRDFQFVLTPQLGVVQGGGVTPISQSNKTEKIFRFELGHYKKVSFDQNNEPNNINFQYCVSVFAMPVGDSTSLAREWTTSLRGTTSALDN